MEKLFAPPSSVVNHFAPSSSSSVVNNVNNVNNATSMTLQPIPIGIQDWVHLAGKLPSKKAYVESGVELAHVLTNHLCQIIDTLLKGNLHGHICAENLRIFVKSNNNININNQTTQPQPPQPQPSNSNSISIKDVKFQFELSIVAHDNDADCRSITREVCVSLGKLLLYIFSGGQAIPVSQQQDHHDTSSCWAQNRNCRCAQQAGDDGDADAPPAGKRQATGSTGTSSNSNAKKSMSSMANGILLESGMPLSICQLVCDLLNSNVDNENNNTISSVLHDNDINHRSSSSSSNSHSQESLDDHLLLLGVNESDNEDDSQQQNPNKNFAIASLQEALYDLTQMKHDPTRFLFDRTCPRTALDDTGLFNNNGNGHHHPNLRLFGREEELEALMTAKNKISNHVHNNGNDNNNQVQVEDFNNNNHGNGISNSQRTTPSPSPQGYEFLCETIFVGGYAGSGKSSLLHTLTRACNDEEWFVLNCKFDKQAAPHMIISKSFNDFFGRWVDGGGSSGSGSSSSNNDLSSSCNHNPSLKKSFHQVCRRIFTSIDDGCFQQLCVLVPNFAKIFPLLSSNGTGNNNDNNNTNNNKNNNHNNNNNSNSNNHNNNNQDKSGISSMDKVGSAKNRLQKLFHVLFNSLCSVGVPVIFTLDDLQWAESSVMEIVTDFVVHNPAASGHSSSASASSSSASTSSSSSASSGGGGIGIPDDSCRCGLLMVGSYRSNEVNEKDDDNDLVKCINCMKQSESTRANVTMLSVGELAEEDISELVSAKLCLPRRYVQELSQLLHRKTRGNSFFVVQFLLSIIHQKLLEFSVKSRRFVWEIEVVDMQMISHGVAELLIARFSQLPPTLMQTIKIASCLGYQVEESTIEAMNSRHEVLPYDMVNELQRAVKEGIMEKAGPVYQFTHDIIQQTVYDLIPLNNRNLLHKVIGMALLNAQVQVDNPAIHLLAMDQINKFYVKCNDNGDGDNNGNGNGNGNYNYSLENQNRSPEERSQFAASNAIAAKAAMDASSFEQARVYINSGIQMLDAQHWEKQYSLSLRLFEMSASVSCMHGDIASMSTCLDAILSHTRTFDDSLKASSLRVKLLASSSKFEEARNYCLTILSNLGEVFPRNVSLPIVLNELSVIQATLRNITSDQIKLLPPLTDKSKLNAMKFLNMLCMNSMISKPMLLPIASCRMITITMQHGFCDDSIVGLATAGYSMFLFTEELQLASQLGRVSEALMEDSPKKHALRSRLSNELFATLKSTMQPFHSVVAVFPDLYNSAMLTGDVENALMCRWNYCAASFMTGAMNLKSLLKQFVMCIKDAAKYQQETVLYGTMAYMNACLCLAGTSTDAVELKTHDELGAIAVQTNNFFCVLANFMCCLTEYFWMRNYMVVMELSEKHCVQHPSSQQKRLQVLFRTFYDGVASLSLARDTRQLKWRIMGEKAVIIMAKSEIISKWNFENKSKLVQAELYYLDGDLESAEIAYNSSIMSAREHKFINEEALACELYGMFFVENGMVGKGTAQLNLALDKYKKWGAMKKANELQQFIDLVAVVKKA